MTFSNPSSRSPSRTSNRQPQSTTPGVLAISSAMLANANQSQTGQSKASAKRSKTTTQRRSQNTSSASLFDPLSPADSPSAVNRDQASRPEPTSALTAMMTSQAATASSGVDAASSPANSPSKRTRSRRRAKPAPSNSDGDDAAGHSLSKSAPASSYLESLQQQTSKRRGKQQTPSTSSIQPSIRSSNSADEWEMPSGHLITGADSLTWQQQAAVSHKSSQQARKNTKSNEISAFRKQQTPTNSHAGTPTTGTAPSGLSHAVAASSAKSQNSAQASPALTWQQAMLQRSTPATPSANIFEALEDGYSGARPSSDHHRTRSSPVKTSRPFTRSQQQSAVGNAGVANEDVADLDKQLNDLVLSSVKPSTAAQPKSAKKAKPVPIQSSAFTQDEFAQSSAPAVAQAAPGTSPSVTKPIPLSSSSTSPTKSALYAGPKFHNSPHAAQLPTPRLAAFLNRNRESSPAAQSPSTTEAIFA